MAIKNRHNNKAVVVVVAVAVVFDAAFEFEFRIGTLPNVARVSRELWEDMFERSELVFPPGWHVTHLGT